MQPAYSYNHTEWLLVREGPSGEAQAKRDEKETARKAGERDEKETARKAGDKEKHRLAARDQGNNNMKRKRSKADKDAKQRALSIIQYRKQTERDPAPWVCGDGTEEDALKALVRYHGSPNVAMLLHTDNEIIKSWQVRCGNIDYFGKKQQGKPVTKKQQGKTVTRRRTD